MGDRAYCPLCGTKESEVQRIHIAALEVENERYRMRELSGWDGQTDANVMILALNEQNARLKELVREALNSSRSDEREGFSGHLCVDWMERATRELSDV